MSLRDSAPDHAATATVLEPRSGVYAALRAIWRPRLALSLVLAFGSIEVCARIDDYISYGAPIWESYRLERLYEYDFLGKRGKPYGQYRQWKLNSLGYRGPELRSGRVRIVCLGASETFGLYESGGETYARRMEAALNAYAGAERYEAVNAAYAGLTLATILRRLPETLDQLKPAVLVYYVTPANYIYLPQHAQVPAPAQGAQSSGPGFEFRIAESMRTLSKQFVPAALMTRYHRWSIARDMKGRTPLPAIPETHFDLLRAELRALVTEVRKHDVEPVLTTHATRFGAALTEDDRRMLLAWRKFYPILTEDGFLEMEHRANDIVREVGREFNVIVVDAAAALSGQPRYFADFSHFTTEGARQMGQLLSRALLPVLDRPR